MAPRFYKLRMEAETANFIRKLPPPIKKKIRMGFEEILNNPHCGKALRDELLGLMSFRVQRFRIVYKLSLEKFIDVVAVGSRQTIYFETLRLIKGKKTIS